MRRLPREQIEDMFADVWGNVENRLYEENLPTDSALNANLTVHRRHLPQENKQRN